MNLNDILKISDLWSFNKGILYYKKIQKIPILIEIDEIPHIILENKIPKQVIFLTKHFMNYKTEFYFTTPLSSNPSGVIDYNSEVIRSYLNSYSNIIFYKGFKKIGFDLIDNFSKWSNKYATDELVKSTYEEINKIVQKKYWDFYSQQDYYEYSQQIREEFQSLWRIIQINKIL